MTCKSNKPPDITKDLFLKWHSPGFGESNPTCHTNPVWEWLIRSRLSAYSAKMELGLPYSCAEGPTWSFDRFGQSRTVTPDGRTIFIAGEHIDHVSVCVEGELPESTITLLKNDVKDKLAKLENTENIIIEKT